MNAFTDAPSTWGNRNYFREKIVQIPRVLAVLILRLCTADSAIPVVFRGSILLHYTLLVEYCCTSKNLRDLYCGCCQVLAVFRPVGTAWTAPASTASTRSINGTKILAIFPVYGECEVYFDHLSSVHRRFDNLIRIYCIQHTLYTDGPTNEMKQITFGGGNSST